MLSYVFILSCCLKHFCCLCYDSRTSSKNTNGVKAHSGCQTKEKDCWRDQHVVCWGHVHSTSACINSSALLTGTGIYHFHMHVDEALFLHADTEIWNSAVDDVFAQYAVIPMATCCCHSHLTQGTDRDLMSVHFFLCFSLLPLQSFHNILFSFAIRQTYAEADAYLLICFNQSRCNFSLF